MQILGIYTCRVYEKEGEKKRQFYKAGIIKTASDGRMYIRLFQQPFTNFYVLENNPMFKTPAQEMEEREEADE
ncbi:MAG TPA: hypothetical protein VK809_04455 [Bacteroidia bacterium]|jgi:hypothetical protein|nr:hypothetical protein [Bacteroidia bacterium]